MATVSLRERWPLPTLEEHAEQALGQQVLAVERAYRVHRFIPFAVAYLGSAVVARAVQLDSGAQALESAIFLGGWIALWAAFRIVGVFAVIAVTPTEVIILKGLGSALSVEVVDPYNPSMDLNRRPQRIAVGERNYRLTVRGWRAVLGAMMRGDQS